MNYYHLIKFNKDKPKSIREVLESLIGHNDGIEYGYGYHDDCKKEVDNAENAIKALIKAAEPVIPIIVDYYALNSYKNAIKDYSTNLNQLFNTKERE